MSPAEKKKRQRQASRRYQAKHPERIAAQYRRRKRLGLLKAYASERRRLIRKEISEIKANSPCKDCDKKFPPECMDFDHLDGKRLAVSHLISDGQSLQVVLAEVQKCEIVCACCHRIRTEARRKSKAS